MSSVMGFLQYSVIPGRIVQTEDASKVHITILVYHDWRGQKISQYPAKSDVHIRLLRILMWGLLSVTEIK